MSVVEIGFMLVGGVMFGSIVSFLCIQALAQAGWENTLGRAVLAMAMTLVFYVGCAFCFLR